MMRFGGRKRIGREINIDLMAIQRGIGSLKELGIKMAEPLIREFPYPYDHHVTRAEMEDIAFAYNPNDLRTNAHAALVMADQILARLALSVAIPGDFVDVLNDQDSKLAERFMTRRIDARYPEKTVWQLDCKTITDRFKFQHPEIRAQQQRTSQWKMVMRLVQSVSKNGELEKSIESPAFGDTFRIGDSLVLTIGRGGLHTGDEPMLFQADDRYALWDFDADSFYPALVINYGLHPEHIDRELFLSEYSAQKLRRLQAKDGGPAMKALADGLKIAINSIFGKTGSAWSPLLDPVMLNTITLLGQFTLLSAIDRLLTLHDVTIISANTDGLTIRVPRRDIANVQRAMDAWAREHRLTLSWTEFSLLARRAINSYLAIGPDEDGNPVIKKAKGDFGCDPNDLKKKAVNQVTIDAAQQYFLHGTPPAETIRACRDLAKFGDYFKCKTGYTIVDDRGNDYGGIARWFLSRDGVHLDKLKHEDGSKTQLVEAGAQIFNDMPDEFPADNIDFAAYERMAQRLIDSVINPEVRWNSTVALDKLSREQQQRYDQNYRTAEPDLQRCQAIDLRPYKKLYDSRWRGNPYNTMKSLLPKLWMAQKGALTKGDLAWLACQLIEDDDYWSPRDKQRSLINMIDWCARLSPFPVPKTREEVVASALIWAREHVEVLQRPRPTLHHRTALDSKFVSRGAIDHYRRTGNLNKLACHICAVAVKNCIEIDESFVLAVVDDVETHLALLNGNDNVRDANDFDRARYRVNAVNAP